MIFILFSLGLILLISHFYIQSVTTVDPFCYRGLVCLHFQTLKRASPLSCVERFQR